MSIVRTIHDRENPYVILNKKALWDENLSLEAVGLWARLLSRPDNWQVKVEELRKSCKCGKDKIYKLLNELCENGYAYRIQTRKKGYFSCYETYVFESKITEEFKKSLPQPDLPDTAFPAPDSPAPGNEDYTNIDSNSINKEYKEYREGSSTKASSSTSSFSYKRIKMSQEKYDKLVKDFGSEKIALMFDKLDEYADINPKRFKSYGCHAAVIRKWIREEKETIKNPTPSSVQKDEEIANNIKKLFNEKIISGEIVIGYNYIEFIAGITSTRIKFGDSGFKEQAINNLRKMKLQVKDL